VQQNVLFGVRPASDGTTATAFAEIAIEHFRLKALLRSMPSTLSGGEQRRVAIASAVASAMSLGDGAILLLDEPFSGLDAPLRDELIVDLRHSLAALSIPVLSVTHDVGEAFQLGAEVIQIAQGRVVAQGPVAQVLAAERIRLLQQLNPAT
jgi:molybdate transport system ATP-binding protein